jgi:hypothetical protein
MMSRCSLILGLVFLLAGCTDNVDSVTREFRNLNNEVIDAMMTVTTEKQAARMKARIFKPMRERYSEIERKLKIVRANRDKKPFVKEVMESDGMQVYLTDLAVNRQRFALEMVRLRNVHKQLLDDADPQVGPQKVCPILHEMVTKEDFFEPLRKQLYSPTLVGMLLEFPRWKVEEYDDMFMKFAKRRQAFLPPRDIQLVR